MKIKLIWLLGAASITAGIVKAMEAVEIANPGYAPGVFLTIMLLGAAMLVDGMTARPR